MGKSGSNDETITSEPDLRHPDEVSISDQSASFGMNRETLLFGTTCEYYLETAKFFHRQMKERFVTAQARTDYQYFEIVDEESLGVLRRTIDTYEDQFTRLRVKGVSAQRASRKKTCGQKETIKNKKLDVFAPKSQASDHVE